MYLVVRHDWMLLLKLSLIFRTRSKIYTLKLAIESSKSIFLPFLRSLLDKVSKHYTG